MPSHAGCELKGVRGDRSEPGDRREAFRATVVVKALAFLGVPLPEGPSSPAWVLHETLMEILRRLNQAAERDEEIPELEYDELARAMARFWAAQAGRADVPFALQLLVENGLVATVREPVYSWDRRRLLGERFRITTLGKTYLVRQLEETGRVR
jgi:hypothetical protein